MNDQKLRREDDSPRPFSVYSGNIRMSGLTLLLFFAACAASAQAPAVPIGGGRTYAPMASRYSSYYFSLGGAAAVPVGGHWGDGAAGFRVSPAFSLAGAKKVDDVLSYGVETAYNFGHKNAGVGALRVRVFSLTPFFRVSSPAADRTYYALLGAGIYHWTQPSFSAGATDYESDSGSSFGLTMGGGAVFPLRGSLKLGAELRWHHIFTMKGDNFHVGIANNLAPSVLLLYGF